VFRGIVAYFRFDTLDDLLVGKLGVDCRGIQAREVDVRVDLLEVDVAARALVVDLAGVVVAGCNLAELRETYFNCLGFCFRFFFSLSTCSHAIRQKVTTLHVKMRGEQKVRKQH